MPSSPLVDVRMETRVMTALSEPSLTVCALPTDFSPDPEPEAVLGLELEPAAPDAVVLGATAVERSVVCGAARGVPALLVVHAVVSRTRPASTALARGRT